MLLVGSEAAQPWIQRTPNDIDWITSHSEAVKYTTNVKFKSVIPSIKGTSLSCLGAEMPVELMLAWPGSSTEAILKLEDNRSASLNTLYLLKMSHRYLRNSPHFEKTRRDILLMRSMGARIEHPALLKQRELETYDYKHPNLTRNKGAFFDPREVQYKWDHDSIHRAVAVDPLVPAYTKYQPALRKGVMTSHHMFDALPIDIRLQGVLEEAYVLALERSQIPFRGRITPAASFKMALQKVCTSITSGWFREFAWEHYDDVLAIMDPSYVTKFDTAVADGIVVPFVGAA